MQREHEDAVNENPAPRFRVILPGDLVDDHKAALSAGDGQLIIVDDQRPDDATGVAGPKRFNRLLIELCVAVVDRVVALPDGGSSRVFRQCLKWAAASRGVLMLLPRRDTLNSWRRLLQRHAVEARHAA